MVCGCTATPMERNGQRSLVTCLVVLSICLHPLSHSVWGRQFNTTNMRIIPHSKWSSHRSRILISKIPQATGTKPVILSFIKIN